MYSIADTITCIASNVYLIYIVDDYVNTSKNNENKIPTITAIKLNKERKKESQCLNWFKSQKEGENANICFRISISKVNYENINIIIFILLVPSPQ